MALSAKALLTYYRQISRSLLTVVDVETTGSRPPQARVIEIAILQASLENGIQQQTSFMLNSAAQVPAEITRLTGISTEMVQQGEAPGTVWPSLRPMLEQGVLTAHNLAFDYNFLQTEYQRLDIPFARPPVAQFCTVLLSRLLLADLPSRRLPYLVQHFRFPVKTSHRAAADTLACWLLAEILLTQIQRLTDDELLHRLNQQWLSPRTVAKQFQLSPRQLQKQLDARECDRRSSRRSNRHQYRRQDLDALYQELFPQQLSLSLE